MMYRRPSSPRQTVPTVEPHRQKGTMPNIALHFILLLIIASVLVASQSLLKLGISDRPISLTSPRLLMELLRQILTTPKLLLGYGLSAVSAVLWLVALSRMNLSFAVPALTGIYQVVNLLVATFYLHERVTLSRGLGTMLIRAGVLLLSNRR